MKFDPGRVLFLGLGQTALAYYRCMLPAMEMGADWAGAYGEPPKMHFATGMTKDRRTGLYGSTAPDVLGDDYDIIVIQQPHGGDWVKLIDVLKERGKIVLYEIDDYVHGIKHEETHQAREGFTTNYLSDMEWAMKHCHGIICSTEYIADHYRHFNKKTYVCRNGLDLDRYNLQRPSRSTVNIGWSGATGHLNAVEPWFQAVGGVMRARDKVCLVSVGEPQFAEGFSRVFGESRAIGVPFCQIEQYPGAMTMFDIAIAPAARTSWWRGKSDLRWLEASALGVPVIADPVNYPDIDHGVTGFHAHSPHEAAEIMLNLVDSKKVRRKVGQQAREYVRQNRGMNVMVEQWKDVFRTVLDDAG